MNKRPYNKKTEELLDEDAIKEMEARESALYTSDDKEELLDDKETSEVVSTSSISERKTFLEDIPDSHIGWIKLNNDMLPSLAKFYPHGTVFKLNPARIKEIRTFTSLADDDSYTVNDKINEILSSCVRVTFGTHPGQVKDILEIDKLFFIFAIRDLTFSNIPNPITNSSKCPKCGDNCNIEIFSNNSDFFEYSEELLKYYDPENRVFSISYVVDEDGDDVRNIQLRPPSIQTTTKIDNYITRKRELGHPISEDTLKYLKYLHLNWDTMTVEELDNIVVDSMGWSLLKYSLVIEFIDKIERQIIMTSFGTCSSCGAQGVTVPFRFREKFRSIFLISNPFRYAR